MLHIGRNIFSLLFSRVLAGVILFLIYTRLAQYLGPEASGQFGVLSVYLAVFSLFVDLGMSQLVIKKMSEDPGQEGRYLRNYLAVQIGLGFLFMLIMDAAVYFSDYPQSLKYPLYVAGLGLFLSSISLPFRSLINARQRLTIIARVNFLNSVINGLFMVLAIVFHRHIFFLSFISVAVSAFDIAVYGWVVHRKFTPLSWRIETAFIKQLFIWAWPFTLLTFFSIYNRIDTLMLSHLRDFKEVGYYAVAYKFWDTLAFIPAVVGVSLYPFFATMISQGRPDQVRKGLETYIRYVAALALPLAAGAFVLADQLTVKFYGPEFAPASPALWLLVAGVSVLMLYSPVNSLMISQQTKAATWITGFNLLFNFTTNLLLIPRFGFVAAAATTLASETIQLVGYTYVVKSRVVDFRFLRGLGKPAAAAAVMGLAVSFLQGQNVWLAIAAGGLIYGSGLLALRFFERRDWELFYAAVNFRRPLSPETETKELP